MARVALYGNPNAFNIQIFAMAGGGYYAVLFDKDTQVFQRRNNASGQDSILWFSGSSTNVLDHFLSYSYDPLTKTLSLNGALDVFHGITFFRSEIYRFVGDYVIENKWTATADRDGGKISGTNWNYYPAANAIIDMDNANFGDGTSTRPYGFGVQLTSNGAFYGAIADSAYNNYNNNKKRALASQSGIAVTWITPDDGNQTPLTLSINNRSLTITQYFFKSTNTLADFMLQAQLAVSDSLGYTGSQWEKIVRVTAYLNTRLYLNLTDVMLVPSLNYPNGMWFRDSFWQGLAIDDDLEQASLTHFESKQQASGQIPTQIVSDNIQLQLFQDEATLLYMIRAYNDRINRGLVVSQTVLTNALTYILTNVINDRYVFSSADSGEFKSWLDTFKYTTNSYDSYTQGLYCVALICAQKLGLQVSDTQINNAIIGYQSLYDPAGKFIQHASDKNYIVTGGLIGEALSLWLFNRPLLLDYMVQNTLKAIETYSMTVVGAKNICDNTGAYLNSSNFLNAYTGGDYQNGASWFLFEYLAYYTGLFHKYANAQKLINQRINLEMAAEAVSHEFIQTSNALTNYGSETPARHGYSWNAASLVIKKEGALMQYSYATKPVERY